MEDAISRKQRKLTTVDDDIQGSSLDEKKRYNEPKFKDFEQQGEIVIVRSPAQRIKFKDIGEGKLIIERP